ncbi:MAG: porin [Burkholderiales bacterium]|nr:porin [Burkholderiales bacterium]
MKRTFVTTLVLAAAIASPSGQAQEQESRFKLSGFGTLGLVQTNTDQAQFVTSPSIQVDGARKGNGVLRNGSIDSKLGLQGTYQVTPQLTATLQFLSKQGPDDDFSPRTEWAYLKYEAANNLSIHAGRIRIPAFMISDSLDVGYSQPWLRPPGEVYAQVPISTINGVDAVYRTRIGNAFVTVQPMIGNGDFKFAAAPQPTVGKYENVFALNATAEFGALTLRAGHLQGKVTVPKSTDGDNPAVQALNAFDAIAPGFGYGELADSMRLKNVTATFTGIGASYDDGSLIAQSEYTIRHADSYAINNSTGWYVMGGYRFGKWTPYAMYSKLTNDDPRSYVDSNGTAVSPMVSALVSAVYQSAFTDQHTVAVGVRYDLMKNVDIKAQFQRTTTGGPAGNVQGLFVHTTPSFAAAPQDVNVLSIATDFIF